MINERNAWEAVSSAISFMNRPLVWLPLFAYMVFKLILLGAYTFSAGGALSSLWALLLGGASQEEFQHYPNTFYFMPVVLGRLDMALQVFVTPVFQAATIIVFFQAMHGERASAGRAFALARAKYIPLVVVTLCAALVLFCWFWLQPIVKVALPIPFMFMTAFFYVVGLCIQGMFIYSMPIVLVDGTGPWQALLSSFRTAARRPLRSFLIVLFPAIVSAPAHYISQETPFLVWKLVPEIVVPIHLFEELLYWPSTVLLMGALAALIVRRKTT